MLLTIDHQRSVPWKLCERRMRAGRWGCFSHRGHLGQRGHYQTEAKPGPNVRPEQTCYSSIYKALGRGAVLRQS